LIRKRTPAERAIAFVRRLNEPPRRKRKARLALSLRKQVEEEFREARRLGR
jgi:hypothetical protein